MRTQRLSNLGPRIKMIARRNRTANPLRLPNAPKLLERGCPINTRLVGTCSLVDIVHAAIGRNSTLLGGSGRGVVAAIGLNDVVFDERVACPAVQRDVGVYVRSIPSTRVGHGASGAGVPAFSGNLEVVSMLHFPGEEAGLGLGRLTKLPTLDQVTSYFPAACSVLACLFFHVHVTMIKRVG